MPMPLRTLVEKYGSLPAAADALALLIDSDVTAEDWLWWPENFRTYVLFRQNKLLLLATLANDCCRTSLEQLQQEWQRQEAAEATAPATAVPLGRGEFTEEIDR